MNKLFLYILNLIKKVFSWKTDVADLNEFDVNSINNFGKLINKLREDNSLLPLWRHVILDDEARKHAVDMCKSNLLFYNLDYVSLSYKMQSAEIFINRAAMNVGKCNGNYKDIFRDMAADIKLRNNLIDGRFVYMGISKCENYWVVIFTG